MAPKVQAAKNVLEGDKHVANVQQMLMSASYPLLQLWNKIISQEEDFEFEAEELLKGIQQSLCAIGSSFQSLNTHRRRRFKGCLAKDFSSLTDSDSDEGLSPFLFGSNLAEKIKSQTEINSLSRKIVVSPPNPAYKPRAQMSRGKKKVYLRKRGYSGRRGARQGDRSRSQSQKEIKSSQTQTKFSEIPAFPRTHLFMDSWKEITGDQEILSLVQGCKVKFKSMPIQSNPPLPFSMSKEEMLVDLEVQNLLAKGAIEICSPDPNQFISNIFAIPKKDEEG